MSRELITPEDAQKELYELEQDLVTNADALNYDYKEINDKVQRILEWLRCVLDVGWGHNEIPDHLNEEAMKMQGAEDGQKTPPEPSANATVPSGKEQEVINHYKSLESQKTVVESIAIGLINCAKRSIDNLIALEGNLGNRDRGERVKSELIHYQVNFREKLQYLKDFRSAHNLNRPAKYESNVGKFFFILLGYLAIETFVNGFFYSKVADGLIESWGIALIVAMLVIALGAGAGEFGTRLRGLAQHMMHRRGLGEVSTEDLCKQGWYTADEEVWYKWEKHSLLHMLSWGIITLGCVILGLIVVVFAYVYRDAAEYLLTAVTLDNLASTQATIAIMAEAMARLSELELQPYSGLSAIALIVINGLMFIISFYKFHFQRDDCIPGYAQICRNLKEAYYSYKKAIDEMDPSLELNDTEETIDKSLENRIREMETFIDGIRDGTDALKDILPKLANEYTVQCRSILESYREANKVARPEDDKEGPAYFKYFLEFESFSIPKFEEEHHKLCEAIAEVDINNIVRHTGDWKNDLLKNHIIEIEKYEASRI